MTSTAGGEHPSPEDLDLLMEDGPGQVTSSSSRGLDVLAEHVRGCRECADLLAGMSGVRALLRAQASHVPPPPEDLEARITAALAREAGHGSSAAPAGRASSADVVPLRARTRPTVPRWLGAAAGLVVLGGAAATATQLLGDGGGTAAMLDAADSGGQEESAAGAGPAAPEEGARVLASGTDYRPEELPVQVRTLVGDGVGDVRAEADTLDAPTDAPVAGEALASPEGLEGCLRALGAEPGSPVVVDLATWQGREVAVVVLDERARTAVWVVERSCRPGDDGLVHYQAVPD